MPQVNNGTRSEGAYCHVFERGCGLAVGIGVHDVLVHGTW